MIAKDDPRSRNEQFPMLSIEGHVRGYAEALSTALVSIDWMALNRAVMAIIVRRLAKKRIWVAGNGGSAAIADHLLCDWVKGTYIPTEPPIQVHSLVAN